MERVQAKLVEEVAGDGDMRGVAHKRHRKHEVPKKEERTKKHKGPKKEEERTKKPKGHKKEERTKQHKGPKEEEERTKKPKGPRKEERTKQHKGNLAMKLNGDVALKLKGAGSEQEGGKRGKTLRLSQELLEYLRTKEVMGFIATKMPRPIWPNISGELFDQKLEEEIVAQFKENREFDAYVLYQYRTKGYAEIDLTDDEEEEEEV